MNLFPWYGIGLMIVLAAGIAYLLYRLDLRQKKKIAAEIDAEEQRRSPTK
jgi:hypothetical protein